MRMIGDDIALAQALYRAVGSCPELEAVTQNLDGAALALMDEMSSDTMAGVEVSDEVQTAMDRQFSGARGEIMNLSLQRREA